MTQPFPRIDGELWAGEHKVTDLVAEFGSPLYVYDAGVIEAAYRRIESAFAGVDLLIAYSVKANSNLEILRRLMALGAGADIVSRGELHQCLAAGFSPNDIVFAGVGKTEAEMEAALDAGILAFNVESGEELTVLAQVAERLGKPAPVAFRVNPDIVADTPPSPSPSPCCCWSEPSSCFAPSVSRSPNPPSSCALGRRTPSRRAAISCAPIPRPEIGSIRAVCRLEVQDDCR